MNAHTLDLKGIRCPLPILKTKKALAQMEAGGGATLTLRPAPTYT